MNKIERNPKVRLARKVRSKICASNRMRVRILKSNRYLSALVYDSDNKLLYSASSKAPETDSARKSFKNKTSAMVLAKKVVEACKQKDIKGLAFDRSFYRYHGVVKVFAEELRQSNVLL